METQPAFGFLKVPAHALQKASVLPLERKLAEVALPLDGLAHGSLPSQLFPEEVQVWHPYPGIPVAKQQQKGKQTILIFVLGDLRYHLLLLS